MLERWIRPGLSAVLQALKTSLNPLKIDCYSLIIKENNLILLYNYTIF